MGNIKDYQISKPKERAMFVACDYVGSYKDSCNHSIQKAREEFFKDIIQIAKLRKHNIISFSFVSTDSITVEQIQELKDELKRPEIMEMLKKLEMKILIGGQYRKKDSNNVLKCEDIMDELEDLSYQYNVTNMIALDDATDQISKICFINEQIFEKFPDLNVDYITVTDSFFNYEKYKTNKNRFEIYGQFTEDQYRNLSEIEIKKMKGLGQFGYITSGLKKIKEKLQNKEKTSKQIE